MFILPIWGSAETNQIHALSVNSSWLAVEPDKLNISDIVVPLTGMDVQLAWTLTAIDSNDINSQLATANEIKLLKSNIQIQCFINFESI